MVEKKSGMSEEGSAGRDVTDCGLLVKGRRAKSVTGPANDKHCLHGLGLCLPSRRMPVAFGSSVP